MKDMTVLIYEYKNQYDDIFKKKYDSFGKRGKKASMKHDNCTAEDTAEERSLIHKRKYLVRFQM